MTTFIVALWSRGAFTQALVSNAHKKSEIKVELAISQNNATFLKFCMHVQLSYNNALSKFQDATGLQSKDIKDQFNTYSYERAKLLSVTVQPIQR